MKVAILIPTKNRPDFIERTIAYYDSLKSIHPIYIGDASDSDTAARTAAVLKRFSNVEVKYFHWEGLGVSQTVVRLAESALAKCQYCAYQGDDDYFIPSSLSQCAEFLSENPDYRTSQGRAAIFTLDQPGPFGELQSLWQFWGVNALEQETSIERFISFGKKYFVTQFSTHRTEEFVQDSQYYLEVKNGLVGELLHCYTFAIKGKSKFLDCLYLILNAHEGSRHLESLDWILQEHWSSDYHKTLDALSSALYEASELSLNNARQVVSEVLKRHLESALTSVASSHKKSFSAKLRNLLPACLKNEIRQLINIFKDASDMRLLRSKRSLFYEEFLPVLSSLTRGHL